MGTALHDKLYNYEVTPPEGAWEKIITELGDSALEMKFRSRINEVELPPPAAAWGKIAAALDEPLLTEDLSSKLYAAEAIPPAATWEKIKNVLEESSQPAIPGREKRFPILRYAAAAVLIGLISWGTVKLISSMNENPGIAQAATSPLPPGNTVPLPPQESFGPATVPDPSIASNPGNPGMNDAEEARNDAALEASKKTLAKLDLSSRRRMTMVSDIHFNTFSNIANLRGVVEAGMEEEKPADANTAGRYIVLMTPEGNFIRMSKKLSDMVCCVSGEEQDENCKDQMDKWRKQLACSSTGHPGNFMDLLSLLSSLQND